MSLQKIINDMVIDAPAGELKEVINDIKTITDSSDHLDEAVDNYNLNEFNIVQLPGVSGKGSKYIDHANEKLFAVNSTNNQPIDIETYSYSYSSEAETMMLSLKEYLAEHYPSESSFAVIPGESSYTVIIYGWKFNPGNFYNGVWKSVYEITSGSISGNIVLDIHYYEDGNVRFKTTKRVSESVSGFSQVINAINAAENKLELTINSEFAELNEKNFKSLRRLLPITRAKINWGKAIGNYKLGQDVVGEKQ